MNTKHKHYEYIVAFAEGKAVEYTEGLYDERMVRNEWKPVVSTALFEQDSVVFRLKPEQKKTVGYRRYYEKVEGQVWLWLCIENSDMRNPEEIERSEHFIRWVDKEFQYDVVEGV